MSTVARTLRGWALHEVIVDHRARLCVGVAAFVLATAFGAQVAIPLPGTPVPITLQTLFVILAGVVLGPRAGAYAMAAYVGVGALGAPVFAGGGAGLPWLLGPTGGYLLAAPAAAYAAGRVAPLGASATRQLVGLTLGVAVMYVGGVSQLMLVTGQSLGAVIGLAIVPFMVGDAAKVLLALGVARAARRSSLERS
jgi:biotin transport system substrate-specific component